MIKFKVWLAEKILPVVAREGLLDTISKQKKRIEAQEREIKELNAYIDGLEFAMHSQRKITINNGVKE